MAWTWDNQTDSFALQANWFYLCKKCADLPENRKSFKTEIFLKNETVGTEFANKRNRNFEKGKGRRNERREI